jgi:hypothetical protein
MTRLTHVSISRLAAYLLFAASFGPIVMRIVFPSRPPDACSGAPNANDKMASLSASESLNSFDRFIKCNFRNLGLISYCSGIESVGGLSVASMSTHLLNIVTPGGAMFHRERRAFQL